MPMLKLYSPQQATLLSAQLQTHQQMNAVYVGSNRLPEPSAQECQQVRAGGERRVLSATRGARGPARVRAVLKRRI